MKLRKETKIGIFGAAMLLLFYWGFNFLKGQDIFSLTNTYYATYDQVNGIQKSSPIVIKGFRVGTISNMSYDPSSGSDIILEFEVKSKYNIPRNSKARIYSADLLGSKAVEIVLGDSKEFLQNGDTLHSEMGKGLFELAGSEIEVIKEKASNMFNQITLTLDNVNKLLSEQNLNHVSHTLYNIDNVSSQLSNARIEELVTNLNYFSLKLKNNSDKIENIIGNVENFSDSLSRSQLPTLIEETSRTMATLNQTIGIINRGEGTLGRLIANESLYDSLVVASGNLSSLLRDLEQNPKRYVHFSLFGGNDKKPKKVKK